MYCWCLSHVKHAFRGCPPAGAFAIPLDLRCLIARESPEDSRMFAGASPYERRVTMPAHLETRKFVRF